MSDDASTSGRRSLDATLKEYGRGVVGGLIFAFAPLYTMEIWYLGYLAAPPVLLAGVVGTFGVLVAYAYYVGLHTDRSLVANVAEALETVAIGYAVAFVVLLLIGQFSFDLAPGVLLARLTLEGMTCAIGVAIGSSQLGTDAEDEGPDQPESQGGLRGLVHQMAYTFLGATVLVAGVAPTAEVVVTGVEAPVPAILATAVLTFALAYAIVHALDFRGGDGRGRSVYAGGALGDAVVTYALGLTISAAMLWMTGRFDGLGLGAALSMTVYLAWPATIGGAIGRLLLH